MEHEEIAGLLQSLPRVEAPKDFGLKVRSRIAAGRPAARGIPVWVKAAVPAALVLAVAGYFGLRSLNTPAPVEAPMAAVEQPTVRPQVVVPQPIVETPQTPEVATVEQKPSTSTGTPAARRPTSREPQGGSVDSAVTIGGQLDLTDKPIADAFAEAGVKGNVDQSGMKVDSANLRSGLKAGDVVESIDGMPVSEKMTTKGKIAGKKLRVRRDGKTVEVVIKN